MAVKKPVKKAVKPTAKAVAKKPVAKSVAAKPAAKPVKPAAKPEIKPVVKPAAKTSVAKPAAKPAVKSVAKKPAAKQAAKPEAKPEAKPAPAAKPAVKTAVKTAVDKSPAPKAPDPKPAVKVETKKTETAKTETTTIETKVAAKPAPVPTPVPTPAPASKPNPQPKVAPTPPAKPPKPGPRPNPNDQPPKVAAKPALIAPRTVTGKVAVAVTSRPAAPPQKIQVKVISYKTDEATGRPILPAAYKPAVDEEYMSALQLEYFRQRLLGWRADLIDESKQTIENLKDEVRDVGDDAERATRETENSLELRTRDRYRKLIGKIDSTLKRVEAGEYGYSVDSGEEIGLHRLEARLTAERTIDEQERWEHLQKQQGD